MYNDFSNRCTLCAVEARWRTFGALAYNDLKNRCTSLHSTYFMLAADYAFSYSQLSFTRPGPIGAKRLNKQ